MIDIDKSSEIVSMNLFRVFDRKGTLLYIGLIYSDEMDGPELDRAIFRHLNGQPWLREASTIQPQHLVGTYFNAVRTQISCEMAEVPKYRMSWRSAIKEASQPEVWPWNAEPGSLN